MTWSLATLTADGTRVGLDSSILISLSHGEGARAEAAAIIVDAVADGRIVGIVATTALVEVLAGLARADDAAGFERAASALASMGLAIRALDTEIAAGAAWLRGGGMGFEDAVHVATARAERADLFLTNDRRIRSRPSLEVVYLDDLVETS